MRADQTDVMSGYNSRRSSYYGGGGHDQNRYSRASYYGNHQQAGRDGYDNGGAMGGPVGQPRTRYGNRMQSDPGWNNRQSHRGGNNGVYPIHGLQQSRDTVNTNGSNGSHSDGPYSNDPSSDNSSFERAGPVQRPHPPPQQDMGEQYGFNGFGKGPQMQMDPYGQGPGPAGGYPVPQNNGMHSGPPPPPKHVTPPAPIRLNSTGASPPAETGRPNMLSKTSNDDKRKSWFKRRFSKD
jgi:hypothetical protein